MRYHPSHLLVLSIALCACLGLALSGCVSADTVGPQRPVGEQRDGGSAGGRGDGGTSTRPDTGAVTDAGTALDAATDATIEDSATDVSSGVDTSAPDSEMDVARPDVVDTDAGADVQQGPRCGDGVVDTAEECDNGAANSDEVPDACRLDCTLAACGDGVRDTGEDCDDGNREDGDGCTATCAEPGADLCRPCAGDSDCGSLSDRCLSLAGGSFCGTTCASAGDCPDGYSCLNVGGGLQCSPESGTCEACWDPDEDGYGIGAECRAGDDCAPTNGSVFPGAEEVCNGIDDDCDGEIDEGLAETTYYRDSDGDGFGAGAPVTDCDAPPGYVEDNTDCNDADRLINPDGVEACNGSDDNCNGEVDEDISTISYYPDADGDGYGDPEAEPVTGCRAPAGYVANGEDCNDANREESPGATERCDGFDNDCDGTIDEGASCPCTQVFNGGRSYLICSNFERWEDARDACRDVSYELVTIDDASENAWIRSQIAPAIPGGCTNTCIDAIDDWCDDGGDRSDFSICEYGTDCFDCGRRETPDRIWIGINDRSTEGVFTWEFGSSAYANWNSGEPNDDGGEDCGEMYIDTGVWNDQDCREDRPYVCEPR